MNFHLYLDVTSLPRPEWRASQWCTCKLNENCCLLIQLFIVGVGSVEEIQFQSLVFCHGRPYLDACVIFPGVGHVRPNFLPAHNDVALLRKISAHLRTCFLGLFSTTISVCLEDCLRDFSGGWLSSGEKNKCPWEQNLIFVMVFWALVIVTVWGNAGKQISKQTENIRLSLQYAMLTSGDGTQGWTNTNLALEVRG